MTRPWYARLTAVGVAAAPLGTYAGWNLRGQGHAMGEGCGTTGSAIPFAVSPATKAATDTRTTLAQLYTGRGDYQARFGAATDGLVEHGYLTPQDAANLYQQVLARRPDDPTALAGLAQILTQTGQIDQALPLVEKALAKHPGDGPALYTLGTIRLMQGQSALAVELYRRALAAQPEMAEAQANLAWILATSMDDQLRNGAEAVRWATSATASAGGQNPALLRILAAAHAEAGQFAEALVVIDRAIGLAEAAGDANLTARLKSQREQYRQHQPLRVPVR